MDAVHGIESLAAGDGRHHLTRSLGLALLISVGYIDLGKWVATLDAGARFGYDLVLLVLLFNFAAVLYQYMCTCIGMVTGKNLAQIFTSPMAPLVLLAILLFSSHIISLTSVLASHAVTENFFGVNLSLTVHHVVLKILAMIPTIYCAKVAGSEAIYQLLILCPVIQAMLLPSYVIPAFRVASSRLIMGNYRISLYVEIFAFLAFLLMLFTNIIFVAEVLFGDSTWTNNLKGHTECTVVIPHTVIVLMSCAAIAFALFVAVTPLKSASSEAETQELSMHSHREALDTSHHREDTSLEYVAHEEIQRYSTDVIPMDSLKSCEKSALEHTDSSETTAESDNGTQQSTAYPATIPEADPLTSSNLKGSKSIVRVDFTELTPKVSTATLVEQSSAEDIQMKSTTEKDVEIEADVCTPFIFQ
ncbi:hypothetical protein ACQ4PT_033655 [Festuca glaucescens]